MDGFAPLMVYFGMTPWHFRAPSLFALQVKVLRYSAATTTTTTTATTTITIATTPPTFLKQIFLKKLGSLSGEQQG